MAVFPVPEVIAPSACPPAAVLRVPVVLVFPPKPKKAFERIASPKANSVPPKLKALVAFSVVPVTVPVPAKLPFT